MARQEVVRSPTREELERIGATHSPRYSVWRDSRRHNDFCVRCRTRHPCPTARLIADLERARELLRAFVKAYEESTPVTEYNVVEANAYCEAAAYLKDAGME